MCKYTPIMKQYMRAKSGHEDKFLFFRMGDFYELFFNDAKEISKLLPLTLTSRGKFNGKKIPMAGFPHHTINTYILKLIRLGKKIAVCEQIGTKKINGLVERKVVKIFTPGTFTGDLFLKEGENNYICCVFPHNKEFGIAGLDLSTGYFFVTQVSNEFDLTNELDRISPIELLITNKFPLKLTQLNKICIEKIKPYKFDCDIFCTLFKRVFTKEQLSHFNLDCSEASIIATKHLLKHISDININVSRSIKMVEVIGLSDMLYLDVNARKSLEIFKSLSGDDNLSLLNTIDKTVTPMGKRLIRRWLGTPLLSRKILNERLEAVHTLRLNSDYLKIQNCLSGAGNIDRFICNISYYNIRPNQLKQLGALLNRLPKLKKILEELKPKGWLRSISSNIFTFHSVVKLLSKALVDKPSNSIGDGNIIKKGFDSKIDRYRNISKDIDEYMLDYQEKERARTGILSLKIFGKQKNNLLIEIPKSVKNLPSDYKKVKTLSTSIRCTNKELEILDMKISSMKSKLINREKRIFKAILYKINKHVRSMYSTANYVSIIDVLHSFARQADMCGWSKPSLTDKNEIHIKEGRHPIIEFVASESFIPNDLNLDMKKKGLIITGANMGGKSTYMRQAAIIILLAHIGSYVPAEEAIIGKIDKIFTRIGANDDLAKACSTFMLEMKEVSNILSRATKNSLILIDEVGRGTDYLEGKSLAYAVLLELVNNRKSFVLFSTHFHDIFDMKNVPLFVEFIYFKVIESNDKLCFLYTFSKGISRNSFGIYVAKMAGLPLNVIDNAKEKYLELDSLKCYNNSRMDILDDYFKDLDPDSLTPKEALDKIYFLKNLFNKKRR